MSKRVGLCVAVLLFVFVFSAFADIVSVPLLDAANTAFADSLDGDRQGGWTDQGSHDLHVLPSGRLDLSGISFDILSDQETDGKSCIVLGGGPRDYLPKQAKIKVAAKGGEKFFYLLHAGAWCPANNEIHGILTFQYDDGTSKATNIRGGRDITEWTQPRGGVNFVRAWSEYNGTAQVALYVSAFPMKADARLTSVDLVSTDAIWMIAAAAIGDETTVTPVKANLNVTRQFEAPMLTKPLVQRRTGQPPRNIVLIIGDGMGLGALDLTSLWVHGDTRRLVIDQLSIAGLCTTHSKNSSVTDSAASGTAFSCGEKTDNGRIGMTADQRKLKSIATLAHEMGKSIAIITSDPLHGATPAVFFANQLSRGMAAEIIADAAACDFDVLIGQSASRGFFLENGKAPDQRNLQKEMEARGYQFIDSPEAFAAVPETAKVVGLISNQTFVDNDRALGQFTKTAMERLAKNPNGFFMMVESTYPDHGGHSNNPDLTVMGTIHADWAVTYAVEFAVKHGDTLVICTADHETGSLIATMSTADDSKPVIFYGGSNHSTSPVPVHSYGPFAEQFAGEIDNIEIARFMGAMWGFCLPVYH